MPRSRETVEERRARLLPGAQWLLAQRKARGWSGRELGEKLGILQERVSAYERAQDAPPDDLVPVLARVFELDEVEVWRQLGKRLPGPFRSDEDAVAYYEAKYRAVFQGVEDSLSADGDPGANRRRPGVRPPAVPHKGDKEEEPSHRRASSH